MRRCLWTATATGWVAIATACGGQQVVDEGPLPADVRPNGLVVLPVTLSVPDSSALEVAARSLDVTRLVLQKSDLPVLGLFDFDLNKTLDEARNVSYDTDLATRDTDVGTDWQSWMALHVLVTENRATNVRDIVDVKAKAAGKPSTFRQHGIESEIRVEAALYDVRRGNRIAWTVVQHSDDPTQFTPGGDPRPGITAAIDKCVTRLFAMAGTQLIGQPGRRSRGDNLVDALPAMLHWRAPELPSLADAIKAQPDEVQQARVYALWDRFAPNLETKAIFAANKAKGVLVRAKTPPFEAGDVVVAIDGKKVKAAYQVDRIVRACSPTPNGCKAEVMRNNETVTVMLRWPALPSIAVP
ncbi:MAG: hypothetical protein FJ100_05630 [Deltaproteobacteria bacterium]|nr:hypothetical protein [Deltaproteobacteria bacterium]